MIAENTKVVNKLSAAVAGLGGTGSPAVRRKKPVYVESDDGEDEKSGQ